MSIPLWKRLKFLEVHWFGNGKIRNSQKIEFKMECSREAESFFYTLQTTLHYTKLNSFVGMPGTYNKISYKVVF